MLYENNLKSYVQVFKKFMYDPVGELGKKLSGWATTDSVDVKTYIF
jgi:hypothetical protein